MTTFTIHSFKGGSGKTKIAINTCALLAKLGYNVCLLDFDFNGPSLYSLFNYIGLKPKKFINDYIEENADLSEIVCDFSKKLNTKGKYFVGFSNPSPAAIQNMLAKGRRLQMRAMERILTLKRDLLKQVDFICFDSSPGLHYSSLNSIVASDIVFLVVKYDISDFEGTLGMLKGIHKALEKKTWLLVNRVAVYNDLEILLNGDHSTIIKEKFKEAIDENFGILGSIPCLCDVALFNVDMNQKIYVLEQPNSPFAKSLENIVTVLSADLETEKEIKSL